MEELYAKVEGIIFDMDGVLFDSERISLEFWMETFEKYGYTMTKEIYTSVMGRNRKGIIEGLTDIYDSSVPIIDLYDEKTKNMIEFMERKGAPIKLGVNELISFKGKWIQNGCCNINKERKSSKEIS